MGLVYRAWNLRLKRVEAVKVIAEEYARDTSFRERFEREIEIAANIDHPHVVTIYDSGEGPDHQLFIAMRYVEGTTMEQLIAERSRLDPELATALVAQVASALDAAHEQGLVHRDVKPANVLLAADSRGQYRAYLTDFGLAKRASSNTAFTAAGMMVGTIDYMAPEQAQGRPVDLRADVYALAATLYKALTGEPPYPDGDGIARLWAKLNESPRVASEVARGLSPSFDALLSKAMSPNPADRYPSAGELARAALAAASPAPQGVTRQEIRPGAMLGDCLLESLCGEGGMGVVYRAKQVKLDRTVAVKVMSKELGDDAVFRAQFERECRIAASIDHPGVVPIHWAGEADGVLYVVMRFIGGGSLKEALLSSGVLEPERAVEVIEQVAEALDAAHERGLAHRDIKPGNILIDAPTGRVLLTDFGLAKGLTDMQGTDDPVAGTAGYMAPERAANATIDEIRAEVYSLGCVLWDLLGGTERPDLNMLAGVPGSLADVVGRATELDPAARYGSAGELARAARAGLSHVAPGLASTPSEAGAADRFTVRLAVDSRQPFAPEPLSSGLSRRVLSLCDEALHSVREPALREPIGEVRDRLLAPLRVAIVGESGEDRALLLSALLGQRIQPDDLDQTASFRYGPPDPSTERTMISLVFPASESSALVELELGAVADAYLVVVRQAAGQPGNPARARVFAELAELRSSAVNTVSVLVSDETSASADDAAEIKRALRLLVARVVPCSVRLAVAANAGLIRDGLVEALNRSLADGREQGSLAHLEGKHVSGEFRRELLDVLTPEGIVIAEHLYDDWGELTTVGLRRRLRELSGIEAVMGEIDGLYQRADALKAAHALADLEQLSYRAAQLAFLRDRVESARFEPQMHVLDLVRALERCLADDIEVPEPLLAGLERLVTARSPAGRLGIDEKADGAELARAALSQFQSWKLFENSGRASPAERRLAGVVTRSLHLIAQQAKGSDPRLSAA
jgi:serine/threonine protein kinase